MATFLKALKSILIFSIMLGSASALAQAPGIDLVAPGPNEVSVPDSFVIAVSFDTDMDETTINDTTFVVNASCTGPHAGIITYDTLLDIAEFEPTSAFAAGEEVTVVLTTNVQSTGAVPLAHGYTWSFIVRTENDNGVFDPQATYRVGTSPLSICAADFDGDGNIDLATCGLSNISVLKNNGNGTFADYAPLFIAGEFAFICAGDYDGDGHIDLAALNAFMGAENVTIFLNDGTGEFLTSGLYPITPNSTARTMRTADLDGDGDLDIVSSGYFAHSISVLLNNGDGTFAAHVDYATGGFPFGICAADIDADFDLDLALVDVEGDSIIVLINEGEAVFSTDAKYPVGGDPTGIVAGDLNADSHLDLITANYATSNVSVLINDGYGTFGPQTQIATHFNPVRIVTGDFDSDEDLDIVTVNPGGNDASILFNNGSGAFGGRTDYGVGTEPVDLCAADLDGDGDLDLAAVNVDDTTVSVLLNQSPLDVAVTPRILPASFGLSRNRPNPFNISTTIEYSLSTRAHVTLVIYNLLGRKVSTIVDEQKPAGTYTASWDGTDYDGNIQPSGVYFYRLKCDQYVDSKKMLLLK